MPFFLNNFLWLFFNSEILQLIFSWHYSPLTIHIAFSESERWIEEMSGYRGYSSVNILWLTSFWTLTCCVNNNNNKRDQPTVKRIVSSLLCQDLWRTLYFSARRWADVVRWYHETRALCHLHPSRHLPEYSCSKLQMWRILQKDKDFKKQQQSFLARKLVATVY